ncbi:MAG: T9SS type A sorting domain-containing protein [Saprospiraceae bacterium]|nr:T9SS type A sorting domain-containing protein [Saprospiraceae bacterium]MCF8252622.1 T9SS type A sorting domain-containing protein [Saprospiraceae bacterium]MCF8283111.1 T9SS type A sorting domain-containing protein [Bacteroidales bacterium]MCF8314207.1 T9SS type A sorting domain-containing protein [Saprospiraceae bacterium]MCF8443007.1 T9SS type A sorting domain-containing protein [Saprospiraceae bacterium]
MKIALLSSFFLVSTIGFSQDFKVIGYLAYWNFSTAPSKIEWNRLTHVNLAFANPDAAGNLSFEGTDITPVVAAAHANGVQAFVSLAGGYLTPDWQTNWNYWMQPEHTQEFIGKIIAYMQANDLDGVDIDLEWQHVNDLYSPFVMALKTALAAEDLPMTAALPGGYRYPQITAPALAAFDWVNLMIYDLTGPWDPSNPGQHSPYAWAQQCLQYWKNQSLPGDHQTLGVPFYGYDFSTTPVDAKYFGEIVAANPFNAQLDQVGQLYYNGIPTIVAKTQLAQTETSGVMIWELGQDAFGSYAEYSLLKAIDETLHPVSGNNQALAINVSPLLYPNPAGDFLNVMKLPEAGCQAQVIDFQGKIRWSGDLESSTAIDLEGWPAGVYALRLRTENGVTAVSFVKI